MRKRVEMADKPSKVGVFKWRGVLSRASRTVRWVAALFILVGSAALAFTQQGFLGIGEPGAYSAYVVVMLAPVALVACCYGVLPGTVMGLIAGALLWAHALLQPLDYYEVLFVTPLSSIAGLGLLGFISGLLFSLALRSGPTRIRAAVRIFFICLFVSWLFSNIFMFNAVLELTAREMVQSSEGFSESGEMRIQAMMFTLLIQLGDSTLQMLADAFLMAAACIVADIAARKLEGLAGTTFSLRVTFSSWLFVVVAMAFMVTSAVSFYSETMEEEKRASTQMDNEVSYICKQLQAEDARTNALGELLETMVGDGDIPEKAFDSLADIFLAENVLDGYAKEADGILLVLGSEGEVLLSDDDSIKPGAKFDKCLGWEVPQAAAKSLETGDMVRVVYDEHPLNLSGVTDAENLTDEQLGSLGNHGISMQLGYLRSMKQEYYQVVMILPASMVFDERWGVMAWSTFSVFVLLAVVFLVVSALLNNVVARRINETNSVLARITEGDLDARVDVRDTSEFESLSAGINTTVKALKEWIAEAETRMDRELATAKAIQESALPRTFPPYPDIRRFDIYASMHPAKEVGGDFYDFFLIGDDADAQAGKLGFVIADVSGKGVPAALFMMTAKTRIRNFMESGMAPGEAIENANRQLCDGNDAGMFVTVFAGVLDYGTGQVEYVNAGHNPALLWRGGSWEWLEGKSGMPLGLFDGFPYETFQAQLQVGDQFLLYTDGVTEAMNAQGELYGEERLREVADRCFYYHPRQLVEQVRQELSAFTQGAEQSDDITMLALEYGVPPEVTAVLVVDADVDNLPQVMTFVHTELDRRLCPVKRQKQLDIALEELFVNVAHYAYPDATPEHPGKVGVSYTYSADPPSITVDIADMGVPYDPLAKPDAVTPDDVMDVPIGGLGILMAKRSVDDMRYVYRDGRNVTSFDVRW